VFGHVRLWSAKDGIHTEIEADSMRLSLLGSN
jgi:hypothetical protein